MATKQFYATGDFKYGTRMLRAGDGPFPMDGPTARLYGALGKISPSKPKAAAKPVDGQGSFSDEREEAARVSKPKRAPRKRTAKKSK
jgi:hypothetical protein